MESKSIFTTAQSKRVLQRMRSQLFGIPLKHRGGTFNDCFVGFEGINWLVQDCGLSRHEAKVYSQALLDRGVIKCIWPEGSVEYLDEDEVYYIFGSDKPGETKEDTNESTKTKSESLSETKKPRTQLVANLEDIPMPEIKNQVQKQLFGTDEDVQICIRVVLLKGPRAAVQANVNVATANFTSAFVSQVAANGAVGAQSGNANTGALGTSARPNASSPTPSKPTGNLPATSAVSSTSSQATKPSKVKELLGLTLKSQIRLHLHRIQYSSGTYSIIDAWPVEDIKSMNFVENSDTAFTLGLEGAYKFNADSSAERNEFLWVLFQLCQQHLKRVPHSTIEMLELKLLLEGDGVTDLIASDESRFITEEEELQIEELLKSRSVHDLDILADELSKEAIRLESKNINELIQSHDDIKTIWAGLGGASDRVSQLSQYNKQFQEKLDSIALSFEQIEQKNNRMAVITRNQQKLLDELQKLLDKISLGSKTTRILERGTFEKGENLDNAIQAAKELQNLLQHNLPPGLVDMKAVHQQMEIYLKLRGQFARRLRSFFSTTFKAVAESALNSKQRGTSTTLMEQSKFVYEDLKPFQSLVKWMRELDEDLKKNTTGYTSAYKIDEEELSGRNATDSLGPAIDYLINMSNVWEKEVRNFYIYVRKLVLRERVAKLSFKVDWHVVDQFTFGLTKRPKKSKGGVLDTKATEAPTEVDWGEDDVDPPSEMDDQDDDSTTPVKVKPVTGNVAVGGKIKREDQMQVVKACGFGLKSMFPMILAEQSFLRNFFQFNQAPGSASGTTISQVSVTTSVGPQSAQGTESNAVAAAGMHPHGASLLASSIGPHVGTHVGPTEIFAVLMGQSELDMFMDKLIAVWKEEIVSMIDRAYKIDRFNCISLWVQTHLFEQEYKNTSSYILGVCTQIKSKLKQLFDRYVSEQVGYINETKFAIVKAAGIMPHSNSFISFVDRVETNGGQAGAAFVEPAYAKLAGSLFDWLNSLGEDEETRLAVRYENFQHIHRQLVSRKVSNLQIWCDKSKALYQDSLQGYVRMLINKRFNAVMDFFDGVDKLYKTVPAENIQFQHTHSNQVIAKLLQKFKLDTVEEGLWKEFRRIKRDITADPLYTEEVWRTFKAYFLSKVQHFNLIVTECYRQQKFPFTESDIETKYKAIEEKWEAKMRKDKKGSKSSSSLASFVGPNPTLKPSASTGDTRNDTTNNSDGDITEFDDVSEMDTSD